MYFIADHDPAAEDIGGTVVGFILGGIAGITVAGLLTIGLYTWLGRRASVDPERHDVEA